MRRVLVVAQHLWRDLSGWRQVVLVLALVGLAASVALDFSGDFWVTHPML
jgi:anti-sigma-K factor RskA